MVTVVSFLVYSGYIVDKASSSNGIEEAIAVHNAMCEKWTGHKGGFVDISRLDNIDYSDYSGVHEIGLSQPVEYTEGTEKSEERCNQMMTEYLDKMDDGKYHPWGFDIDNKLASIWYYKNSKRTTFAEALDRSKYFKSFKTAAEHYRDAYQKVKNAEEYNDSIAWKVDAAIRNGEMTTEGGEKKIAESCETLAEYIHEFDAALNEVRKVSQHIKNNS